MPLKILLVDDNPLFLRSIRFVLQANRDWEVMNPATNSHIALDIVQHEPPDVVVLDFSMPEMDGLELAHKIRKIAPGVTMYMFTLHRSAALVEEAKRVGIKDVLSKSDSEGLVEALRSLSQTSA